MSSCARPVPPPIRTSRTVAPCARNRSLRCTSVTRAARSSSCCAQSNAESPPPMITMRWPRNSSGSVTTSWTPRPYHGSAHACGSRRGENAPIPAAMTIARVGKRSCPSRARNDRSPPQPDDALSEVIGFAELPRLRGERLRGPSRAPSEIPRRRRCTSRDRAR